MLIHVSRDMFMRVSACGINERCMVYVYYVHDHLKTENVCDMCKSHG